MRRVRIGAQNTPSGIKKQKAKLLRGDARYIVAFETFDENNIEIVAIPEGSDALVKVVNLEIENWVANLATANSWIGNRRLGNVIAYRNDLWTRVDAAELHVKWNARPSGLHLPWSLLECKETGAQVIVFAVHLPTKRDASRPERRRIRREIGNYARDLFKMTGIPVVIAGDMNDRLGFKGFKRAVRHGVDQIFSIGLEQGYGRVIIKGVKWVVSDHPLVYFLAKLPVA